MTNDQDLERRILPLFPKYLVIASMVIATALGLIGITATAVAFWFVK